VRKGRLQLWLLAIAAASNGEFIGVGISPYQHQHQALYVIPPEEGVGAASAM
jgi:hypothetical protein